MSKKNTATARRTVTTPSVEPANETEPKSEVTSTPPDSESDESQKRKEASAAFSRALEAHARLTALESQREAIKTELSKALEVVHTLRGPGPHKRDGREYTIIKRAARVSGRIGYFFRSPDDSEAEDI